MVNLSKYITWTKLRAITGLQNLEVFNYLKMGLPIYSKSGKLQSCPGKFHKYFNLQKRQNYILKPAAVQKFLPNDSDLKNELLPRHSKKDYEKATTKALEELPENLKMEYLIIENEMSAIYSDDPLLYSWKYFDSELYCDGDIEDPRYDLKDCLFNMEEVIEFIEKHNIEPIQFDPRMKKSKRTENIPKGMRYSRQIEKKCKEIAAKIWEKEIITITDMCKRPEIKDVAINKSDKPYTERTIRKWIKCKAPSNKPGRRPKKSNSH